MTVAPKNPKDEAADKKPEAAAPEGVPEEAKPPKKDRTGKTKEPKEGKEAKGKGGKKPPTAGQPAKSGKPIPDNPNFRYIVRVSNTDLDGRRATALALTGVRGVGLRLAEVACRMSEVNPHEMIGNLPESTVDGLEGLLGQLPQKVPDWMVNHPKDFLTGSPHHYFGPDLETSRRDDVNQMRMIRSYRGVRHERGQKVRGQRTRSNGRTGMATGVLKKAAKEAAAAKSKEGAAPAAAPVAEKKE